MMDANKDGYACRDEFTAGCLRLLNSNAEANMRLVFDLYDFDHDKLISQEDIRTLLCSVPLARQHTAALEQSPKEGLFTQSGGGL